MTRRIFIAAILASVGCGPLNTEPMPDIPETVEYDTVRIEYGDDDLIDGPADATVTQMLVGDPSVMAQLAQGLVRGTNRIIRGQLRLIDEVVKLEPTSYEDGIWTWDNERFKRQNERVSVFTIEDVGDGQFEYQWRVGNTADEKLEIFSGNFTPLPRVEGFQRGSGLLRFDFDNMRAVDDASTGPRGRAAIAFRSVGEVRQVRVATFDLIEAGRTEPKSSRYEYVQFPDDAGRFQFGTSTDFLQDGEPHESLSVDAVWTPDREGRALASLTGGTLELNEVLLHECWEPGGTITFADATPDLPGVQYEDGEESACAERLLGFELAAPRFSPPQTDPEIPAAHPDEIE